jgi:hypothetical protein
VFSEELVWRGGSKPLGQIFRKVGVLGVTNVGNPGSRFLYPVDFNLHTLCSDSLI